jgi:hypothetical protein
MSHELIAALVTVTIFSALLVWALLCDRLHRHQNKSLFEDGSVYEVGASSQSDRQPRRYQAGIAVRRAETVETAEARDRVTGTHG